jgi:2-succinyl-6-hydroxy-2,4-cyclohexadiene-1-carboxylate synthase
MLRPSLADRCDELAFEERGLSAGDTDLAAVPDDGFRGLEEDDRFVGKGGAVVRDGPKDSTHPDVARSGGVSQLVVALHSRSPLVAVMPAYRVALYTAVCPKSNAMAYACTMKRWDRPRQHRWCLLHGFTSDLRMWYPVARRLEEGFRLILPDMRGHGLSDCPADRDAYAMAEYVADLETLLDALEIDLCAVVGCSFGGMVAMNYAVEHPQRTAAVVLSDTSPAYEHPAYDDAFRRREERIAGMEAYVERYGTMMLGKKLAADIGDSIAAQATRQRYARMNTDGFLGAAFARRTRPDLSVRLGEIPVPVMLVAGMDDPVYCALAVMVEALPRARQVIFRDTGHGVPSIHPSDFADALAQFFIDIQEGQQIARQITV